MYRHLGYEVNRDSGWTIDSGIDLTTRLFLSNLGIVTVMNCDLTKRGFLLPLSPFIYCP